ncbi:MAG: NAD-dependent epimerase/dehydratase family protein [Planctomycetota bacterium]|jgi:nucleoside-diphosphate-sugar epimerase|nr:NAD-dependent epimerase/dehydratase family protein [Planctomycetota bacterium]MEC8411125.1 NAD-dependent epimerase/dehydratase family protein [Planctomycetota bacterium]
MRWLVTGYRGFLGRAILTHLRNAGIDAKPMTLQGRRVDLLERTSLSAVFQEENSVGVLHLAGIHGPQIAPSKFEHAHVETTRNLLEQGHGKIKRWISVGSAAEYGLSASEVHFQESSRCVPATAYGHSKLKQTQLVQTFCEKENIPWVVFRAFNVFGPQQKPGLLIPDTLVRLRRHKRELNANFQARYGTDVRDFLPIRTLCEMVLHLVRGQTENGIYNACSGVGTSVAQITAWLASEMGINFVSEAEGTEVDRPPNYSVGNPTRIQRLMKDNIGFNLEQEIRYLAREGALESP